MDAQELSRRSLGVRKKIISIDVSAAPYREFVHAIADLGQARRSSYVCVANVHMVIEAWRSAAFAGVVNDADVVAPDGMPLAQSMKLLHGLYQERVAGMDLLPALIVEAEKRGLSLFFYGSTDEVLEKITSRIRREHPGAKIVGTCSPPFRLLNEGEEQAIADRINRSGAHLVLVALGCPRQEYWMARQRGRVAAVMVGVGGAFPVYAGVQQRAPAWMRRCSLEWLFRLGQEPRRLFARYLVTNTLFVLLLAKELVVRKGLRAES